MPLDLGEARNAVELSRLAGADRFATDTFNKAAALLATADLAKTNNRGTNAIMMSARPAPQTAQDPRITARQQPENRLPAQQPPQAATRGPRQWGARHRAQGVESRARRGTWWRAGP